MGEARERVRRELERAAADKRVVEATEAETYAAGLSVIKTLAAIGQGEPASLEGYVRNAEGHGAALDAALAVFDKYERLRGDREDVTAEDLLGARRGAALVTEAANAAFARIWLTTLRAQLTVALEGMQGAVAWQARAERLTGRAIRPLRPGVAALGAQLQSFLNSIAEELDSEA